MLVFSKSKRDQNVKIQGALTTGLKFVSRERVSSFSLKYRAIRPSVVFGTRREAALLEEGFSWVPDLGSFLKLREIGVSPYLGFTLRLSVFTMFELNEVVRGN